MRVSQTHLIVVLYIKQVLYSNQLINENVINQVISQGPRYRFSVSCNDALPRTNTTDQTQVTGSFE